jgi:hypothetical protein
LEQAEVLEDLVDCAERHFQNTGRYLQVWGELGEIYAEVKFELCRHGTHRAGSDGTIGGKLVEVKTISPEKASDQVVVKSQGDFEQLLVVRIDENFAFTGKLFDREELAGSGGGFSEPDCAEMVANPERLPSSRARLCSVSGHSRAKAKRLNRARLLTCSAL